MFQIILCFHVHVLFNIYLMDTPNEPSNQRRLPELEFAEFETRMRKFIVDVCVYFYF